MRTRRRVKPKERIDNLSETIRRWCLSKAEFSWDQAITKLRSYERDGTFQVADLYRLLMVLVDYDLLEMVVEWDHGRLRPMVVFLNNDSAKSEP